MALHPHSTDRTDFSDGLATFIKGLHQTYGVPPGASYQQYLKACGVAPGSLADLGDFENGAILAGGRLNGPLGAFTGQLVGPASTAYTVPAAPALKSVEYAIELVELYWAAVLRDTPFSIFATDPVAQQAATELDGLALAHPGAYKGPLDNGHVTPAVLFRGGLTDGGTTYFKGEEVGPYISQFMLLPATLGAIPLDQKIRARQNHLDYMTSYQVWDSIQNGNPPPMQPPAPPEFEPATKYVTTCRDAGSYTQMDELYQAYLVAYLVASELKLPHNAGTRYETANPPYKNQKAFGNFGGPDISATLAAVARSALDAVWFQKWRVHLRHRPEVGGAIVHLLKHDPAKLSAADKAHLGNFNIVLNSKALAASEQRHGGSALLPQAFPEGSPTHPAYPTGHGTVGGACITVLKYFLQGDALLPAQTTVRGTTYALPVQPAVNGQTLVPAPAQPLTVNGELHKLAHNVSFGHGIHSGIHWRSDTDWSIVLGEEVAIAYLENQTQLYPEAVDITITKLDGTTHTFSKPGL